MIRTSILRARGVKPATIVALRRAARKSAPTATVVTVDYSGVVAQIREAVAAVKTPNGTTKKIARILDAAV